MTTFMPRFPIEGLPAQAFEEFNDASDYFWKSLRFLRAELTIEAEKIGLIPGADLSRQEILDRLQSPRWIRESTKIEKTFSYLIINGNIFAAASLFETYMLLMCKAIEKKTGEKLSDIGGTGLDRFLRYIRSAGLKPDSVWLYNEVVSIVKIRNCIYHANGLLAMSKEEAVIRSIVSEKLYFEPINCMKVHRRDHDPQVFIVNQGLGEQVQANGEFPHYISFVFRNYFCELFKEASKISIV